MDNRSCGGCGGWFPIVLVLLIIGYLFFAPIIHNQGRSFGKAKEAETKQNLHAIQLAVERYSVDSDAGFYPLFIMGGDWTDSYAVTEDWSTDNGLADPEVEHAEPGMGDALILESYMPSFPQNPFRKIPDFKQRLKLEHCNHLGEITTRFVGGSDSRAMVEVFGPKYISTGQTVSGDLFVHHIYNNPPYNINDMRKEQGVNWNKQSGNEDLVGNFSYFPRPQYRVDFWLEPHDVMFGDESATTYSEVGGYTLAGYGSIKTHGQDVYNRNGNYKGRYRTEPCKVDCSDAQVFPNDIPCICPAEGDLEPTMYQNNGGSDTLPDGVVVTLDSGVDKRTSRVNFSSSEEETKVDEHEDSDGS